MLCNLKKKSPIRNGLIGRRGLSYFVVWLFSSSGSFVRLMIRGNILIAVFCWLNMWHYLFDINANSKLRFAVNALLAQC